MRSKIENTEVVKVTCRVCRKALPNRRNIGLVIIDAVEHAIREQHKKHTVACTFVGERQSIHVKHTIGL